MEAQILQHVMLTETAAATNTMTPRRLTCTKVSAVASRPNPSVASTADKKFCTAPAVLNI
jgi:hypothetical protein